MRKFKSILVYANSEHEPDPGVNRARKLAEKNGATLTIVDVVEKVPRYLSVLLPASWDVQHALREEREARLEKLADGVRDSGLEVTTDVLVGRPSVEITKRVVEDGIDLVVKTARPDEREGAAAIGRVAIRLMRLCPSPVWVVQDANAETDRRILAAVDPQTDDPAVKAMNARILDMAGTLAEDEDAEFHVAHAWFLYGERLLKNRMSPEEFESYRKAVRSQARDRLDNLLKRAGRRPPESNVHLLHGEPGETLVRFVNEREIDLVVLGTVARQGLAGVMLGNTAERIFRGVRSSLLTVKREDFTPPIGT